MSQIIFNDYVDADARRRCSSPSCVAMVVYGVIAIRKALGNPTTTVHEVGRQRDAREPAVPEASSPCGELDGARPHG